MKESRHPADEQTGLAGFILPKSSGGLFIDSLFASIGDGAIATDQFSRIIRANPPALQILGYSEKEIMGEWFPATVISLNENGEEINSMERPMAKAFLTGRVVHEKIYYRHKDGHAVPVFITVSPIIYKGRLIGAINLFRDMTDEYEIERMKSEFISLASHQLRTPLSSIKTYSHMLSEGYMGKLTGEQKSALGTIIESTNRMNQLTNTLLNITRIESGFFNVAKRNTDLTVLAKKIIREQSVTAAEKNIKLSFDASPISTKVSTDPFIAEEILTNLISNAIKYTPANGHITVQLKTKKNMLIYSVSDTGIGIPKQAQSHIFNKFYRASNVLSRDTTGTGLGLYLAKGLAEQLNAKLWFESESGNGTTFYFALPLGSKNKNHQRTA